MLILVGDIGGTNTRLRLIKLIRGRDYDILRQAEYASGDYPDLAPIVADFLTCLGHGRVDAACFAIAGPVIGNTSRLTNLDWYLEGDRLAAALKLPKVGLINDFAAVCYGVQSLVPADLSVLQEGMPLSDTPVGVIGAGTGLGEGFLIPQGDDYQIFATEGGHADFAPRSQLELELLDYLMQKYQTDHVSVERVVSGQGIVAIYQFLRDKAFVPESLEIGQQIRDWEQQTTGGGKRIDAAAIIATAAMDKRDRLCEQTLQIFVEAYAAEAGNFALKLLPFGGLYLAGGIAPKLLPLFQDDRFMSVFRQKGRLSPLLERIRVQIILNQQVGLQGSILYALR
ncbi:MAG: glucokinase [Chloroflexaceae bacterium]|nr:glucokinase [Chloroflexaceae bacterium]